MIVCPNCSRENENHYKFCLGCGTELSQSMATSAPIATALPTAPVLTALTAPVLTALPAMPPPSILTTQKSQTPPPSAVPLSPPLPPRRTESIDELPNRRISEADARWTDGDQVRSPHSTQAAAEESRASVLEVAARGRVCRSCETTVPDGFKFCGVCGTRYEVSVKQNATIREARLVLIHPDGREGGSFPLPVGECAIGRDQGIPLFAEDPFLSPRHAVFSNSMNRLTVRDESSLNGVFFRIGESVELGHRDLFRVGQQLLRFEDLRHVRPLKQATDGTQAFGSPARGIWGRLASMVAVDTSAEVWSLSGSKVQIGRENGDITFSQDGFVSGSHCTISTVQGRFFLEDQGSTNGTYLRIKGERNLADQDLLLLGQHLFRVMLG